MLKINTALVLIDVQVGFDDPVWGERNNPDAEQHIGELLTHWRRAGRPVIHVQHLSTLADSPLRPDRSGNAFKPEALPLPDEALFQKSVNSAFIGTDLQGYLKRQRVTGIVLVGLTTDHCVSTTARMGANLGFAVTVVEDAVATFERSFRGKHYPAGLIHETALASLAVEFAEVVAAAELLL
ncbi:cysteine hydrolase family protein [Gloeobacter kilaueensis]|uniref:Isochorismatase hydrolase n=1 Tax=Gloeobacter kilaueensis (strain ATCC BAA-2537 / CCAP 1431/1 / ULC 316 / JS1) TaxID=1183438 RepID=U5QEZ0_GLOK1|nr:cysteine hydrolase family protein [Gloeobacter kilaueensis]AGY57486.1 isochorismatase hydrolase [Gloeobacter kilaueensis JS1]